MTVLMTVSSTSTSLLGDDLDDLVERMRVTIQSRLPKAVKCRPVVSVSVTVLPLLKRLAALSAQGFQFSIDDRVGIVNETINFT
ncbi:hypothetical protein [Paraburkholderia caledonica]|uniref:hypothetical protein n=1 Tax=Paraburkholderia caledonica TaxID=134536 RepID=UPI003709917A